MRTIADYDEMRSNWTPEALHTYMRTLRYNVRWLEDVYQETLEENPTRTISTRTIQIFVEDVGLYNARETIASLILRNARDNRISNEAVEWAKGVEDTWDEQLAEELGVYTNKIHMAHLDQIGREMAKHEKDLGKDLELE